MMSEQRFEVDGVEVERFMLVFGDDGTRVVDNQTGKELYAIDVVDLLNEQQTIIKSKDKELERLYNYFKHYLKDEMSGNAFSEMWDFVKEDEKWEDE